MSKPPTFWWDLLTDGPKVFVGIESDDPEVPLVFKVDVTEKYREPGRHNRVAYQGVIELMVDIIHRLKAGQLNHKLLAGQLHEDGTRTGVILTEDEVYAYARPNVTKNVPPKGYKGIDTGMNLKTGEPK